MLNIPITIGEDDKKLIDKIFIEEKNFQPRCVEDVLIMEILRQIKDFPLGKTEKNDNTR